MADYLALEHARVFRRLLVVRCGLMAVVIAIAGAGFGWLPPVACWVSVAIFLLAPASAWVVECRRWRDLERRFAQIPPPSPWARSVQESRKKSISTDGMGQSAGFLSR